MADEALPSDVKRQKLDVDNGDSVSDVGKTDARQNLETETPLEKTDSEKAATKTPVTDLKSSRHPQECDVGITEYISQHKGMHGVIKQRYSDFLVHEIDLRGKAVTLTNTDIPSVEDVEINTKVAKDVSDKISVDKIDEITDMVKSKDRKKTVLISVGDDKTERTNIHQAIAEGFQGLDTATVTKDGQKYIEVKFASNQGNNLRQWPRSRGDYCRFVLYKENKDTMDAVSLIAKQIGLKASLFQYAGTKDRRAKTSQEITVYRVSAEKLKNNNKRLRNIVAGNFRYVKEPLKLGQLLGNRFTIVLRSVTGSCDQIQEAVKSLEDKGFINYYGMQRFGTSSIPTHHIGRQILQGNWKETVELILQPRNGDDAEVAKARNIWWEKKDSKAALHKFPRWCFIERSVLQGLLDSGESNYLAALNKIPRNTRLMYVHSYQSYIWNKVTSHRIKTLGLEPVIGDLVIPKHLKSQLSDSVEDCELEDKSQKPVPICVDESNIKEYTIEDVVLPLPGYDVVYPSNVSSLYKDLMATDQLDCDSMRHKVKDFSLSGDYRHILVRPTDVSCKVFQYNDVSVPLALSDQDILDKKEEPESLTDGAHTAVRLQLSLPTSCYATMAIREILKTDTSAAFQSTLNVT